MKAWEALELSKAGDQERLKKVLDLIKQVALERRRHASIPLSMSFEGLETHLTSLGYKVTHGDQREPGIFVSWADATKPVSFNDR